MRNPFTFPLLVLLLMLSSAILLLSPDDSKKCICNKEKAKQAQAKKETPPRMSWSEFMTKKVAPLDRLEQVNLFPEEGSPVVIPTADYLNRLEASIQRNWPGDRGMAIFQRIECERLLGEVWKGYRDITSRLNPVYGRPVFNEGQLRYVRWSERQIAHLLKILEYECTRLTPEERRSINF